MVAKLLGRSLVVSGHQTCDEAHELAVIFDIGEVVGRPAAAHRTVCRGEHLVFTVDLPGKFRGVLGQSAKFGLGFLAGQRARLVDAWRGGLARSFAAPPPPCWCAR